MPLPVLNIHTRKVTDILDEGIRDQVRSCVVRYTVPTTVNSDYFIYVGFRIFNAVKAIFNYSEWQVTRRAIVRAELTDLSKLMRKLLPQDKDFNQMIAESCIAQAKKSLADRLTAGNVTKNRQAFAEECLLDLLEGNAEDPSDRAARLHLEKEDPAKVKPPKGLSLLVTLKDMLAFNAEMRKALMTLKDDLAADLSKESIENTLRNTPEAERQEMLDFYILFGIDKETYRYASATISGLRST